MSEYERAAPHVRSVAEVATPQPGRYLTQLCKHFQHKRAVTFDERTGRIVFDAGECRLEAGDGVLKIMAAAPDDARLAQVQDVVARHLLRFAFREEMKVDWQTI